MASIRMIPWLTAIPVNAINPIQNGMENGLSRRRSPIMMNGKAMTTEKMMMNGCP